jgi:hypothetical protein
LTIVTVGREVDRVRQLAGAVRFASSAGNWMEAHVVPR